MYLQKWNDWIFGSLIFNSSASIKLNVITFLILYVGSFEAYTSIAIKNGAHEETVDKKLYAVHYRHIEVIYLVKAFLHLHVKYM